MSTSSVSWGGDSTARQFGPELLRQFSTRQRIGTSAGALVAVATAGVLWAHVPHHYLISWLMAQIAIALFSLPRWNRFQHTADDDPRIRTRVAEAVAWKAATGLLWGVLALFSHAYLFEAEAFFAAIAVAAVTVGSISTMAAIPAAVYAFIILSFTPFIVGWLSIGDTPNVTLGILSILLLAVILASANIAYRQMLALLRANFDHRQLSDEFASARGEWLELSDAAEAYAVFDDQERLLAWNDRFAELRELSDEFLRKGTPRTDLIRYGRQPIQVADGGVSIDEWIDGRILAAGPGEDEVSLQQYEGGQWLQRRVHKTATGNSVVSFVDFTDLVNMESALGESEERYRLIAENSPDAIFVRVEDEIVYVNPAAVKMFRAQSDADLIGLSLESLAHPDDRTSMLANRAKLAEETVETLPIIRLRMRRLDGTYVMTAGSGAPHIWQGKPAVLVTRRDITDQIESEKALREGEETLRAIVENMPGSIVLKDTDLRIRLAAGRGFGQWSGRDRAEAVGKKASDILPADLAADIEHHDRKVLETGEVTEIETNVDSGSNDERTFLTTRFPVKDGSGTTIGVGIINHDVTEQRRTEAQLQQAQKMEVVGQLTGGIAHDFNNLLTVILGNAELLTEYVGDQPEAKSLLDGALRSAQRGADLTQRLLAFSRRQNLNPEPIDINERIAGMVPLLERTLPATITLRTNISTEFPPVDIDPTQLESAIMNLTINARDAIANAGEIEISTSVVRSSDIPGLRYIDRKADEYALLTVRDTGEGMSDDIREHVFEPFFTTKPVGAGSGLGLSMVYGFVTQSGGHVSIDSQPGQGTSVKLHLPISQRLTATKTDEIQDTGSLVDGGKETILVVEDDEDVRTLVVGSLTRMGYRVVAASDGPGALKLMADTETIDVLLTDVVLPNGLLGPEIARELVKHHPNAQVLLMSGYTRGADTGMGDFDEPFDLIQKPFTRAELGGRLRQLIAQSKSRKAPSIAVQA